MRTSNIIASTYTTEYLGKSYVWALYNILPDFGFFKIEMINSYTGEICDSLEFSKNTDEKEGHKELAALLRRYPDYYHKLETQFNFGFGFDLSVKVYL